MRSLSTYTYYYYTYVPHGCVQGNDGKIEVECGRGIAPIRVACDVKDLEDSLDDLLRERYVGVDGRGRAPGFFDPLKSSNCPPRTRPPPRCRLLDVSEGRMLATCDLTDGFDGEKEEKTANRGHNDLHHNVELQIVGCVALIGEYNDNVG